MPKWSRGRSADAALTGADWLITGEGRSDVQTLHGKAVHRMPARAGRRRAASLLSGAVDPAALPRLSEHFPAASRRLPPITLDVAIRDAADLLANEAEQLTRLKYGAH